MDDACKNVLIEKNLNSLEHESETSLYLASLITRERYEQLSKSAGAKYKAFQGSYDEFRQRYEKDTSSLDLNISEREKLSALSLTSLPGAVNAWAECMRIKSRGLFCWLEGSSDSKAVTLWIEWAPPLGSSAQPLKKFRVNLAPNGGMATLDQNAPTILNEGRLPLIIRRSSNETAVTGKIAGELTGTKSQSNWGDTFYVPGHVAVVPFPETFLADNPNLLIRQENIHRGLHFGKVYWQDKAILNGTHYPKALGMHAPHEYGFADFSIPSGARLFQSDVGLARQDALDIGFSGSSAVVYVEFDSFRAWTTELGAANTFAQTPMIQIPKGARVLRLAVHGKGANGSDHTTWANPRFLGAPAP